MSLRREVGCVAAIAVVAIAVHWPAVLAGRVLLPADIVLLMRPWAASAPDRFPEHRFAQNQLLGPIFEYYSWRHYARERIRLGEIPLWNPHELGGNVLLANSQSAVLYPPNVLLYLLRLWEGINLVTVLHTFLTGAMMFGLLRSIGLCRPAAVAGALTWMLSACLVAWTEFQTPTAALCWLPGALWAWEVAVRRRSHVVGVIGVGVALALSIVAGHLQFAFYVAAATAAYVLWRTPRAAMVALPCAVALALGLSAVTLLPVVEAGRINHRSGRSNYKEVASLRLPPSYLTSLVLPNARGNPRDYVRIRDGVAEPGNGYVGRFAYVEYALYVGIPALILALAGLAARRSRAHAVWFTALGLLALAVALGTPLLAALYYVVPGFAQFNAPARAVCLVHFALAALAGVGADRLLSDDIAERGRAVKATMWASGAVALGVLISWVVCLLELPMLRESAWVTYNSLGIRSAIVFAASTAGIAYLSTRRRTTGAAASYAWALTALCAVDLGLWSLGFNPATDPAMLEGPTEVGQVLRSVYPARVLSLDTAGQGVKGLIVPNYNAVMGYREVQGADSIHTRRYHEAIAYVAARLSDRRPVFPEPNTVRVPSGDHPLFDALNVKLLTTSPGGAAGELDPRRFRHETDSELTVWSNPRAAGSAWIVGKAVRVSGPEEAVVAMSAPGFDVLREAVVERAVGSLDAEAGGRARLTRFSPHALDIDVESSGHALLVVSETAYPGWHARVKSLQRERAEQLLVADGVLRAVKVEPGRSLVRLRYEPPTFRIGLFITCGSVMVVLAGLIGGRRRRASPF